ncbi:T9SS type A sorting domain-containing protein [Pseudotamlana agarivorans]|uniref:T9SS type A sorting domain-containing protein n=1 Tax=Pseudotamlana agarivorans TaxID=481183 RepID=UPI00082E45B6|nr:T9SS type A sorting domain-containing protein [Tamlana agarivorans]
MKKIKLLVALLLFTVFSYGQNTFSWDNSSDYGPKGSQNFYPGQVINMTLSYSTPGDFSYIQVILQEKNSSNVIVNSYGSDYVRNENSGQQPDSDSFSTTYTIAANAPTTLPAGNYYFLHMFMWTVSNGGANDSRNVNLTTENTVNTNVSITLNAKHIVGGKETFERSKYIGIHANQGEAEWDGNNVDANGNPIDLRDDLLNGLDVYLGRDTGGITYNLNQVDEDPARTGFAKPTGTNSIASRGLNARNSYASKTAIHPYESRNELILAGQLNPFWTGHDQVPTGQGWLLANGTATGEYMGRYINEFHSGNGEPAPSWVEVINEPAYEGYGGPGDFTHDIQDIADFHNEVAAAIKTQTPNALVGGYTTAFPNFEKGDFQRWNKRWKLFMDVAGANMDFFSIHLYDIASKPDGTIDLRSGSNIEATFDMMEQYSTMLFNNVKPIIVSEMGGVMNGQRNQDWSPYRDWLWVKSANAQLMSMMERPNIIAKALPFLVLKAQWGSTPQGNPYNNRLMRQENEPATFVPGYGYTGNWVYSDMIKFYQLWSDVKGTRVDTTTDDLDIQVDAYVDGNKAYIILNNLEFVSKDVDLKFIDTQYGTINSINKKHFYLNNVTPVLLEESIPTTTSTVTVGAEGTMILEVTFDNAITLNDSNTETKYYATDYLKPIVANQTETFQVNGVSKNTYGEAVLRLGVGRPHSRLVYPSTITVNNTAITIPSDWRGYDQAQRERFFGVLEIPVPFNLIQANNTIEVTYPDAGGHISSVTMQIFNFNRDIRTPNTASVEGNGKLKQVKIYPNPTKGIFNLSAIHNTTEVKIYTISGVEVKKFTNLKDMDISNLEAGIYFIKTNTGGVAKLIKN